MPGLDREVMGFPQFNIYSLPLIFLVLQGFFFAGLLIRRYIHKQRIADLFLALLVIIVGYSCTSYVVGFMDWYDTFPQTKINYFLFSPEFVVGPLVYLYIRSIIKPSQPIKKIDWLHFAPAILYAAYEVFVYVYDASQPGFADTQNGVWLSEIHYPIVTTFEYTLGGFSILLYLAFGIQLYLQYRREIVHFFSNTYEMELGWLRNFLVVSLLLFCAHQLIDIIGSSIADLTWTDTWWTRLASATAVFYLGIKGYFTDLTNLYNIPSTQVSSASLSSDTKQLSEQAAAVLPLIERVMQDSRPYLKHDLTLSDLAREVGLPANQLSQAINIQYKKNFNDFINGYRIDAVKRMIESREYNHLTLLGIAQECGFNSKATFNRTFKKLTLQTPSEFQAAQQ